jgi:predicted DNA-binding protein (MmcQ/YjbR family)
MTIDSIRTICRALPDTTEDIKWDHDLVFSVGGRMFAVVCLEPPHTVAFKCTPEAFAELVERDGIIPAPYLARAMWVQEQGIGGTLDRQELIELLHGSYELVVARLPKKRQGKMSKAGSRSRPGKVNPAKGRSRSRGGGASRPEGRPASTRKR